MDSVKHEEDESRSVGVDGYEYHESDFYPDLPYVGDDKHEEEESRSVGVDGYEYHESDFYPDLPYIGDYQPKFNDPGLTFLIDDDLVEELYPTGLRPMLTVSQYNRYMEQVHYSGGFDVDPILNCEQTGLITPVSEGDLIKYHERFMPLISEAIAVYNVRKRKNFRAVRIVKMNAQAVCVCNYFITFEATDGVSTKTFQTKIWQGVDDQKIKIVREKPWYIRPAQGN